MLSNHLTLFQWNIHTRSDYKALWITSTKFSADKSISAYWLCAFPQVVAKRYDCWDAMSADADILSVLSSDDYEDDHRTTIYWRINSTNQSICVCVATNRNDEILNYESCAQIIKPNRSNAKRTRSVANKRNRFRVMHNRKTLMMSDDVAISEEILTFYFARN